MKNTGRAASLRRALKSITHFFKNADILLFALCTLASVFGIVLISSATRYTGSSSQVLVQCIGLVLGVIVFVFFSIIDVDTIMDKWKWLFAFSVFLLLLLIPFGKDDGTGNRSWLRLDLGFIDVGLQPAELVKIFYTIILAKIMTTINERQGSISSPISIVQITGLTLVMLALVLGISHDAGVALIYIAIFGCTAFAAGVSLLWFLGGIGVLAACIPFIWNNLLREDQRERILAPYFPDVVDPTGLGITWQQTRSKLAIGSGKVWGMGLYNGTQTQSADPSSLPARHTDFIFSVAGEELGLIGCLVIIALLVAIIVRIIQVGVRCRRYSGLLICSGLAGMMLFQTFENIGMCIGLTPVIGLTLPFFSYGGTSMVTMFLAMGIVSSIKMHPAATRSRWVW